MAAPFFRIIKTKKKKKLYSSNKKIQFTTILKTIHLFNEKLCNKQMVKFNITKKKLLNLLIKK